MLKIASSSIQTLLYGSLQIGVDNGSNLPPYRLFEGRQLFVVYCCTHGPSVNRTRRYQVASGPVILAATDFSK
jgi:hypothetical protein